MSLQRFSEAVILNRSKLGVSWLAIRPTSIHLISILHDTAQQRSFEAETGDMKVLLVGGKKSLVERHT